MSEEFRVPDLGENIEGGDVVSVLVNVGDEIGADQNVLELETDKAVVELPCPLGGSVEAVHVSAGDRLSIGDLVLTIATNGAVAAKAESKSEPESQPEPESKSQPEPEPKPESEPKTSSSAAAASAVAALPATSTNGRPPAPAAPATRRLARELGVDLHAVSGSGPSGRITRDDVKAHVRQINEGRGTAMATGAGPAVEPLPDFSQWGEVEIEPLKGVRKVTADAMSVAWSTVPHVTQFDQADITELEAARRRYESERRAAAERSGENAGGKITMTVLALKACAAALRQFPQFNSSLDIARGQIVRKQYVHIGIAVDTPHGLLVPVLRDVDKKTLEELAAEMTEIAARARDRKVDLDELRGGSFTITNLGGIGGTAFTPIVNYPEVAILGIARGKTELQLRDGSPQERLMLPLCLSYDHRVIDGADGARFVRFVAELLADPFRLMLQL